ncbi:S26 family signal peptidase [Nonomuraea sp. B1E8]|uniref:S26 family signal peptidase n=1 Tax=unclassified Nonomuraea TaxID=2593643 RepID=UPI00325E2A5B
MMVWAIVVLATGVTVAALLRRRIVVVTVTGISMTPTIQPGNRLLVRRCGIAGLKIGDIVVLEPPQPYIPDEVTQLVPMPPQPRWNVKRVAALPGDPIPAQARAATGAVRTVPAGSLIVLGDNGEGRDSRQVGLYPADRILGVALRTLAV